MHEVFRLNLTGASRRCDNTVFEQLFKLSDQELAALPVSAGEMRSRIERVLATMGLKNLLSPGATPGQCTTVESVGWFYVSLVTGLQRIEGHRVKHIQLEPREDPHEFHVIFEYEHMTLGGKVANLVMAIICEAFPGLEWPIETGPLIKDLGAEWTACQSLAADTILPPDAEAMLMAARQRGIPCVKLEREPYQGLEGDFRIRRNSMLKLGHCAHQLVLDGMLCIDKSAALAGAYHDRSSLVKLSEMFDFDIPVTHNNHRFSLTYAEAEAVVDKLHYPVVIKPRMRSHGNGVSLLVETPGQLAAAVRRALAISHQVLIERHLEGEAFRVLVTNNKLLAVIDGDGRDVAKITHESILTTALKIANGTGVGILEMTIVTAAISLPLSGSSSTVVDVDLAPRLDRFLQPASRFMQQAVTEFLLWLYPEGTPSRIPVIAVTGTNGKTTTSRMIERVLTHSGLTTALCCTDGIYRDGELQTLSSDIDGDPHAQQLEDPEVEAAVLETHFGHIARLGFSWQECSVGVCTNVTPDHLGRLGTETLEDMAELKRSITDRSRHAILNADDPRCMAMLGTVPNKPVTLTTLRSAKELDLPDHPGGLNICSIEEIDGRNWVMLTEKGEEHATIAVNDIPATHHGAARHNVANAQQAIAATKAVGVPVKVIVQALARFEMSFEDTPGRLNIHDNGRFKVIMDFAHNLDGYKQLSHFTDSLDVKGRRIIIYSASRLAKDEWIMKAAAEPAGHFDLYICRDCHHESPRPPGDVPRLMRQSLEAQGVAPEAIREINDEFAALEYALALCEEGDLLAIRVGPKKFNDTWKAILETGEHASLKTKS